MFADKCAGRAGGVGEALAEAERQMLLLLKDVSGWVFRV